MWILNKNKDKMVALQLVGWGVVLCVTLFLSVNSNASTFDYIMFIIRIVPLLFLYIINYVLVIPKLLFNDKRLGFIIVNSLIILSLVFLASIVRESEILTVFRPDSSIPQRPINAMFYVYDVVNCALMVGLVTAVKLVTRLQESEEALKEAENARVEAELANLRSQINPHFLLNTLNNIYSLTVIDTERAQKAIKELSRLLQYVLYDNCGNRVSILKEVEFLENYIELMRIRLNPKVKLTVDFDVKPHTSTQIAPLIFISLIENAFKHGVCAGEDSFITINFADKVETGEVILSITNRNHAKSENDKSGHGIGLEQVRKRLDLQYENAYTWNIDEDAQIYKSELVIKTNS
ncbi:MAG: histidine kinase [Rikenellaceae bacterium]